MSLFPARRLALGCTTFGREIPEATAFALVDFAVAHGITLFDTAEAYGGGQARAYRRERLGLDDIREVSGELHSSEKIIGRWLTSRGCRDQITLVTKVTRDFSRAHVRAALEASLARLQTDRVDLYLYHSYDSTTPAAETAAAMDAVIRAGLTWAGGCMIVGRCCISPSPRRRRQLGPGSKSSTPSRSRRRPNTCCATAMASTATSSPSV